MRSAIASIVLAALVLGACSGDGEASSSEGPGEDGVFESPTEDLGEADEGIDGVHAFRIHYPTDQGPPHRDGDIVYGHEPAVGGLHDAASLECGFYDEPVREENVGHSLEHGAVWLSFAPDLSADDVAVIEQLVNDNDEVLAAPYEDLEPGVAVVATSWARQLTLESVDDPRLAEFVAQYENGDQHPEPGVPC
jgi:hypothetical protein